MSKIRQVAMLLLSIGEVQAANVMQFLDPTQIERIAVAMAAIKTIPKVELQTVLAEFDLVLASQESCALNSQQYLQHTLVNALGTCNAEAILERLLMTKPLPEGFESICWQTPAMISALIQNEHPQIIAVIVTYLDSAKAIQVLKHLPGKLAEDVIARISTLNSVSTFALQDLMQYLQELCKDIGAFKTLNPKASRLASELINHKISEPAAELIANLNDLDELLPDIFEMTNAGNE